MFKKLQDISSKPEVFDQYTADSLWTDPYRAQQMLAFHLNEEIDVSSRKGAFIKRSCAWIAENFQLAAGKSVCDFGCGPGLYTVQLAKTGAQVTGLDFSENSIGYARAKAEENSLNINYVQTNYLEFEPPQQYELITMIMCDFCALSPAQRKALLKKFYDALKPNGALLLDVYSMAAYAERQELTLFEKNQLNQFWCPDDYYCFLNTFKYDDDAVVLDKYSIFPENGEPETVYNWLQYFSPESLTAELSAAGFDVQHIYKDVAAGVYDPDYAEFAVVASKK